MHSFSSELDLLHDVVNLPRLIGHVVDSPPSAFHQQHPKRSCDVSTVCWKMWTHSSLPLSADPGSLCRARLKMVSPCSFTAPPGPVVWHRVLFPSLVVLERCGLLSFLCGLFPELQSRGTGSDERAHICICFRHWWNHWNAIIHQVTFLKKKYFVSWTNNNVPVHRKQCGCAQIWDL